MKFFADRFLLPAAVVAAALALAGLATIPMKSAVAPSGGGANLGALKSTTGGGMLFGVLGGYRSLIADLAWVKSFIFWERRDMAGCLSSMELATSIDPYMTSFWTEGAATIAFDTPHWLAEQLPPNQRTPERLQMFKLRQGGIAINYIDKGLAIFPHNEELIIQKGKIAIGMDDYALAEKCYAEVAAMPDPPVYVLRVYGGLLQKNGKYAEALAVFKEIESQLETDSPILPIIKGQISETEALLQKTR